MPDELNDAFGAPDWVMPVFSVLRILGFPVAVLLAWAYEMTPTGIKHERDSERRPALMWDPWSAVSKRNL